MSLSLLQLLILCASGVLWLMRSLGCKSYISFPHSYQRPEFLKCRGQSPNILEPPLTLLKWVFSPKKIAISTSRCWDGLYRLHISRYWKEKLLLYYPIPEWEIWVQVHSWNMECLYHHGEKGWKKSAIIMLLWKLSVSSKFTGGQYCFMRFCLRLYSMNVLREKILTAQLIIMRFHYIWCSQKTGGCMVSSKNYETVRYLGHHPWSKLVLTIKLCYSWKAYYYSYFLDEKLWQAIWDSA